MADVMKAVIFPTKQHATFVDRDIPVPKAKEVLVKVHASGICHTDFEVMQANYGTGAFPVVPGHEYAGVIADIGPDVHGVTIGDRVVVDPNIECGKCLSCRRGWAHLCENLNAYGVTQDGGFAEYSLVHYHAVHSIQDLPFDIAALAEPMGCVLNGLAACQSEQSEKAIIFGAGPMGVLLAIAMRVQGHQDISLVDIDDARLSMVDALGFQCVDGRGSDLARFYRGSDLAIDATGSPRVAADLVNYMMSGGVGLFFGVCPQDQTIEISPFEVFRRQLRLVGSHSLNHNIPDALAIMEKAGSDLTQVVSHKMPLDQIAETFKSGMPRGAMKVQAVLD